MSEERESVRVLREAIELQLRKSRDYQNPSSSVVQADHYRRGIDTIHDIIRGKELRATSLLESKGPANFESLEDTYIDMINYCSFAVSWLRGKVPGQKPDRDIFNQPLPQKTCEPCDPNFISSTFTVAPDPNYWTGANSYVINTQFIDRTVQ
jgi:hypothetical protein